jgi:hypothetical protein
MKPNHDSNIRNSISRRTALAASAATIAATLFSGTKGAAQAISSYDNETKEARQ